MFKKHLESASAHGMYAGGGATLIGAGLCFAGFFFPPLLAIGGAMVAAGLPTALASAGVNAIVTKGGTDRSKKDPDSIDLSDKVQ